MPSWGPRLCRKPPTRKAKYGERHKTYYCFPTFSNIIQHHLAQFVTSLTPVMRRASQMSWEVMPGGMECQSLQMPIWTQNHWRIGKSAFKNMAIKIAGIYGCSSPKYGVPGFEPSPYGWTNKLGIAGMGIMTPYSCALVIICFALLVDRDSSSGFQQDSNICQEDSRTLGL